MINVAKISPQSDSPTYRTSPPERDSRQWRRSLTSAGRPPPPQPTMTGLVMSTGSHEMDAISLPKCGPVCCEPHDHGRLPATTRDPGITAITEIMQM
ncbi:hypothetical protein J6590_055531 [Homalodisca vitripennis]|nr:hypothetical protein J6590_055531 [Homalodisca vitripennis]